MLIMVAKMKVDDGKVEWLIKGYFGVLLPDAFMTEKKSLNIGAC